MSVAETPALVVLAAGASERLGTCKALVDLGGRSPLERLLAAGASLEGAVPVVVAGAHAARIAAAAPAGCEVLANPDWSAGRSGGVRLAAAARPGRDLCLAPVDVPLVPAEVFAALAEAWERAGAPARGWLAPRWVPPGGGAGRHGHPVVVGRALLADLKDFPPSSSLRVLRGRAEPLLAVDVLHREVLDDLDTPADLEALRARLWAG